MKLFGLLAALTILSTAGVRAQESADLTSTPTVATPEAVKPQPKVTTAEKPQPLIKRRTITASGFLVDVSKAPSKRQLLSLRKKPDPVRDAENVWTEPKTGRPMGFRLFSFNF